MAEPAKAGYAPGSPVRWPCTKVSVSAHDYSDKQSTYKPQLLYLDSTLGGAQGQGQVQVCAFGFLIWSLSRQHSQIRWPHLGSHYIPVNNPFLTPVYASEAMQQLLPGGRAQMERLDTCPAAPSHQALLELVHWCQLRQSVGLRNAAFAFRPLALFQAVSFPASPPQPKKSR